MNNFITIEDIVVGATYYCTEMSFEMITKIIIVSRPFEHYFEEDNKTHLAITYRLNDMSSFDVIMPLYLLGISGDNKENNPYYDKVFRTYEEAKHHYDKYINLVDDE